MTITRTSPVTGCVNTREIDVTEAQIARWHAGTLIQVAMPHLSNEEREFIMTGLTTEDWVRACKKIDHRIECYSCGYPACESQFMDTDPPLPCQGDESIYVEHIQSCSDMGVPQ